MPQQRDYFRIPYPVTERPQLIIGADEFQIVDLSESGARIAAKPVLFSLAKMRREGLL